jgi:hypothetical protein
MGSLYYVLFAATGEQPPYIKNEVEDVIVRQFNQIYLVCHELLLHSILTPRAHGPTRVVATSPSTPNPLALTSAQLPLEEGVRRAGVKWKQTDIAYTHKSVKPRQGAYKRKPKDPAEL